MKINYDILLNNPLFKEIDKNDIEKILNCLSAKLLTYKKETFIILADQKINFIGIVMSGKVAIIKEDSNGNRNIIAKFSKGELFGEAFACAEVEKVTVSIQAIEQSEILLIDYKNIISTCPSTCDFHAKLIENMISILASKVLLLNKKIDIISKRTIREKLMAFFGTQKSHSNKFTIPYNREELADFLFVDRSAMSRELSKMRDEGIIKYNKNDFEIIN